MQSILAVGPGVGQVLVSPVELPRNLFMAQGDGEEQRRGAVVRNASQARVRRHQLTHREHVAGADRLVQGRLPELVLHPRQRLRPPGIFAGDLLPSRQPDEEGDHVGVAGPGGAVQGRVAAAVARVQEACRPVVDRPGFGQGPIGCYDVERRVAVGSDPSQEQGRRWRAVDLDGAEQRRRRKPSWW